jgi:hypothetical protein
MLAVLCGTASLVRPCRYDSCCYVWNSRSGVMPVLKPGLQGCQASASAVALDSTSSLDDKSLV